MSDAPPASDRFEGRVVVVSGAGSRGAGIGNGRAAAVLLASAGARVALLDRNREWAQATAELVAAAGGTSIVLETDVSEPDSCEAAVKEVVAQFGGVYGLVNNVGIGGPPGTAIDVDPDDWDLGMRVNVKSMMLMSKYCLPHMIAAGCGSIVNVSSVAGLRGGTPSLLYPTSKAAVIGLTRAMATHHGRAGVRVNCVAPGMVYTPMVASTGMTEQTRAARADRSLLGTEGNGWDVGHAVRFLLSDEARWITGVVFPVDAGTAAGSIVYPSLPQQR
ncbi:SDR family NAD(P)-dependent oxidoreductase [Actinophytocola sp.]|uniref:SDR family NAD(P)-dependent oxidoreductase n=1 Tax=Actinophytocola sp. TaxID=1872138 RepID=UPI002D7F4F1B|nr:SDR family NAD(P)-dependent oxidoreductase [Actinophytocola sp.]HET9139349.1 SDR family NAD(P)-dependent oxidoreductase [Actinophytocola sp.]